MSRYGIMGSPPLRCFCCGEPESRSGCVRGFTCGCIFEFCYVCHKCSVHCNCAGGPVRDLAQAHALLLAKYQSVLLDDTGK